MGVIKRVALGWLVILIGLLTAHVCVPQRSGPLALSEVLEPYFVPPFLRALVDPPGSEPIAVIVIHPLPARFVNLAGIPVALDTAPRDAAIGQIRSLIDGDLAAGRSVVVLGDLNTTERKPAYLDFSAGMRDAHLDAGVGPGFTWGPGRLGFLPFGLVRIDYIFATPDFAAQQSTVDCNLRSDHCRVEASFVRTI